jgi:hypothetical protein
MDRPLEKPAGLSFKPVWVTARRGPLVAFRNRAARLPGAIRSSCNGLSTPVGLFICCRALRQKPIRQTDPETAVL